VVNAALPKQRSTKLGSALGDVIMGLAFASEILPCP